MNIGAGNNIKITVDGDKTIISADTINNTNIKCGAFKLSGDEIEIIAGENVIITTAHPNKMTISANIDKERVRIKELEQRVENLENFIKSIVRKKNDNK